MLYGLFFYGFDMNFQIPNSKLILVESELDGSGLQKYLEDVGLFKGNEESLLFGWKMIFDKHEASFKVPEQITELKAHILRLKAENSRPILSNPEKPNWEPQIGVMGTFRYIKVTNSVLDGLDEDLTVATGVGYALVDVKSAAEKINDGRTVSKEFRQFIEMATIEELDCLLLHN